MRRLLTALVAIVGLTTLSLPAGASAAESEWHSEQPVGAIGVPVPLGPVGGMAFWSPNKGVLITAGNAGSPAGVYAYDGSGWYLYSTVCGGHEGSIAISGPDEFWTVADYGEAQEGINGNESSEFARTLCHFANGEVVASYAEPAASPDAFLKMNAAACEGASDCWFGGRALSSSPNHDPFHLHWDGGSLTAVPSLTAPEPEVAKLPGEVSGLAFAQGRLFESANEAPYLREISLGDPRRFLSVEPSGAAQGPFVLSTERLQQQLWAAGEGGAVLHLGPAGLEEVGLPEPVLVEAPVESVGGEPGAEAAWLGGRGDNERASVRRLTADGSLGPIVELPQPSEELNSQGPARHIACGGIGQCWVATFRGWLFHLGGVPAEGVNADPLMHRLITSRPKDASSRTFVAAGLPADDSGEIEPSRSPGVGAVKLFPVPPHPKSPFYDVHQKLIGKRVLQVSFKLRVRAHVQLRAKFHSNIVAKTPRQTLEKGPHRLRLKLDPKRWPTGLDFQVHPIVKKSKK